MMFHLPISKMLQHALLDNGAVKVTACDVYAAAGIHFARTRVAEAHDRDIERAAAKVKDDDVLWLANGLFVIQCCCDGFEFKVHFLEASIIRGLSQNLLRLVILLCGLGKFDGAPKSHSVDWLSENIFGTLF